MLYSIHLLRHLRLTIGRNMTLMRQRQHKALADIAAEANVSPMLWAAYERGQNEIDLNTLFRIGCALDVTVQDLMVEQR